MGKIKQAYRQHRRDKWLRKLYKRKGKELPEPYNVLTTQLHKANNF